MTLKCKYCGKEIDGVLPAPLTCWSCYHNEKPDAEILNKPSEVQIHTSGEAVKECEGCHKVLPIDYFYKVGKDRNRICKDCVVLETSCRCLNLLSIPHLRKMCTSGVTADYMANEWKRTRGTCQSMLGSLVKTNNATKEDINGKLTYFMTKELADTLIEAKKSEEISTISPSPKIEQKITDYQDPKIITLIDNTPSGFRVEKHMNKGLYLKEVPIEDLGNIIKELRTKMEPDINFEINTQGENAQIFLSEEQIFRWAYNTVGEFLKAFDEIKGEDYTKSI